MCAQTLRNDRSEVQRFKKEKETKRCLKQYESVFFSSGFGVLSDLSPASKTCVSDEQVQRCAFSSGPWFHRALDQPSAASLVEGKGCGVGQAGAAGLR